MVNSMTGFGRATAERDGRECTVELKSVNHRYLDLGFRMPRYIGFTEDAIRTVVSAELSRGHVDVYVFYKNNREDARTVKVDAVLLGKYLIAARAAAAEFSITDDLGLSAVLKLPDVTEVVEAQEDQEAVCALVKDACKMACDQLKTMREKEGRRLRDDLMEKAKSVESLAGQITLRAPKVVEDYRKKLSERIAGLLLEAEIDRARLATEVALFADRAGIDEELVRLHSHLEQMRLALDSTEPAGRRLDFIVQEMNREFNTIGSKANDAEITNLVIAGKGEVEKIREQVQNIE